MNFVTLCAILGAGFSMGIGALGPAMGEGIIALNAVKALSRQPRAAGKLMRIMLIGQAITETPAIFALVISLLLLFQDSGDSFVKGVAFLIAGIAMGISTLGASFGASFPGKTASTAVGRQPENIEALMVSMIIGQAITGTTVIYTTVVAMILIFVV
ncbi:ATP synthase F0 subunit C [bacterium]|nr:ATP synthase F0 subunit C [bacterium]MBT3580837.1 ATP synthase F0 subunit C [bacterium]MBT4552403.1 ATP synthase F0 subunit C [bacterium]MBT5989073.1 ATP synthase F0 subunit C [bacterium]MBT7088458.1 ATP synthase F0 subunit C [bacterium]